METSTKPAPVPDRVVSPTVSRGARGEPFFLRMNDRTLAGTKPLSFTKQLPGSTNEGIDDVTARACSTIARDLKPCREDALDYGQKPLALTSVLNSGNEKRVDTTSVFRGKTRCRFASDVAENVETGNKSMRSRLSC